MPLTAKGEKIKSAMEQEYGTEKGEKVFYASRNSGRITAVDAASVSRKVDRSAFLYMAGGPSKFAQCETCRFFDESRCAVLDVPVKDTWSCGLYVEGKFDGMDVEANVSVEEAGVFKGSVRCENCRFGGDKCELYEKLNEALPELFDLDAKIEAKACCNAFKPNVSSRIDTAVTVAGALVSRMDAIERAGRSA